MREIRTSGVTRGEHSTVHGMRVLSHNRGNPETDVDRSLNTVQCSPTLLFHPWLLILSQALSSRAVVRRSGNPLLALKQAKASQHCTRFSWCRQVRILGQLPLGAARDFPYYGPV